MGQIADLIRRVLDGKEHPEALGKYWQHDLTMPIYERSCQILAMPIDRRRAAINDNPTEIAKLLAAEVKRLYLLRPR
jgi:hypothetical protein